MVIEVLISGAAALGISVIVMLLVGLFTANQFIRVSKQEPGGGIHGARSAVEIFRLRSGRAWGWIARETSFAVPSRTILALRSRLRAQVRHHAEYRAWERWFEKPSRREHVR